MYMQPVSEGFGRPVESIMRCEDFKSNFARRLSNRYISRSPVTQKQDNSLKLAPNNAEIPENAPESIEPCSQLSQSVFENNGEVVKPPDKTFKTSDSRNTEVSVLNMEVETLKWQLSQTEANRQMHIALLKQIVSFLNRIKEHIECQKPELPPRKETMSARLTPRSFNAADLPRSRSVVHVNKTLEYSLSPAKKISTRKISKSISNVNGYRDCSGAWTPSKLNLTTETESSQKITEEMSRLIILANTVLGTKLPDLVCSCDIIENNSKLGKDDESQNNDSSSSLHLIKEDTTDAFILETICENTDTLNSITSKLVESKDKTIQDFLLSSPLNCSLENDFADSKINAKEDSKKSTELTTKTLRLVEKKNEYNHAANFVEDESGFSSMSSFQEIGIPIISIIPPSPCKEMGYVDNIVDILDESAKWKNDVLDLEKQSVKVFWV